MIDDALPAARLTLNWQDEVEHIETAVILVEAGLGYAIVPSIDAALQSRSRIGRHSSAGLRLFAPMAP